MTQSFYWHDYETFGTSPAQDRPVQFAGVRTDSNFNIISEPLVIYCKPSSDTLPHPQACLITGITPQQAWQQGIIEAEFAATIFRELAIANTCSVGYNSLRFDDEVSRYLFYRNFYDPYAREWQNGNSRWDLIDVMRACYALRPQGFHWPQHDNGEPSFKLEQLSIANGIEHSNAHDALADVNATIELAKQLKQRQPRLLDHALSLRNKAIVKNRLKPQQSEPLVYISAHTPNRLACTSLIIPLAINPDNPNAIISYDLRHSPQILNELPISELRERLFTSNSELPNDHERVHLNSIQVNRCPFIAPLKTLDEAAQTRTQLDIEQCFQHLQQLRAIPNLVDKVVNIVTGTTLPSPQDPEQALYNSFISNQDRQSCEAIRQASAASLSKLKPVFTDKRLPELFFRYKARNYPQSLSNDEQQRWQHYRQQRLLNKNTGASLTLDEFEQQLQILGQEHQNNANNMAILEALAEYASALI